MPLPNVGAEIQIRLLRTIDEIEEMRTLWLSLRGDCDIDRYLRTLRSKPEIIRPHVIAVFREERPSALLVGWLENNRLDVDVSFLTSLMPKFCKFEFIDCSSIEHLTDSEIEAVVKSIICSLANGEASLARLNQVNTATYPYRCANSMPVWNCRDRILSSEIRQARTLHGKEQSFLSSLTKNERNHHKRRTRALALDFHGNVRIEHFDGQRSIAKLMSDAEIVAKTSYLRELGRGFFHNEAMRQRLELEAQKGRLLARILYLDDHPCAFWITSRFNDYLYSDFMGYDAAYAKYSPGMFLIMSVIEELTKELENDATLIIDFGGGEYDWKARLANRSWSSASIIIFAPTLSGIWANIVRTSLARFGLGVKSFLRRRNLTRIVTRELSKVSRTGSRR